MRLIVMFDLPVVSDKNRKQATKFRNYLMKDGYDMLQYSVYSRICANADAVDKHIKRLITNTPLQGAVRILTITNKQFSEAVIAAGQKDPQEKRINESQLILF